MKRGRNRTGAGRQGPPGPKKTPESVASKEPAGNNPLPRLHKVLAAAGIGSRRQCEEYISAGRVSVDNKTVTKLGLQVDPATQRIEFDGEPIKLESKVYWWLYKPAGVICTNRDTHGRTTIFDLIPPIGRRVYSVGRLDEESTGLMLLTNDGDLANRLTHPRYGVRSTYEVLVMGRVSKETMERLEAGVWFEEGKVRASKVRRLGGKGDSTRLEVVLAEGPNRALRRMFARFDHKVITLVRTAIGPIEIRRLRIGQSRPVASDELAKLRQLADAVAERAAARPAPRRKRP